MSAQRVLGIALVVLGFGAFGIGLVRLFGDGGGAAAAQPSPSASTTVTPTETPSATPTDEPTPTGEPTPEPVAETPEEFFAALGAAFGAGDDRFLFSRLHPFVFERYGRQPCRANLAALDVPDYAVEVLGVEGRESFVYETDDLRRRVQGATTVRIRFTEDGETFVETDAHVVLLGGRYLWFTDCGTPATGAA